MIYLSITVLFLMRNLQAYITVHYRNYTKVLIIGLVPQAPMIDITIFV